jgi:hypothetical protein
VDATSKSPKRVLVAAYAVGRQELRAYAHRFSPKKFTQPQLFACLVLKEFLCLDYRKLSAFLKDAPSLSQAIGLVEVPHFTTFQKAARRLLRSTRAHRLLTETVREAAHRRVVATRVKLAALDGTGFETHHISAYFLKRREKGQKDQRRMTKYTRFPYAGIVCDCASHFVLAVVTGRGPGLDMKFLAPALLQTTGRTSVETLLADAGFDSERAHCLAREEHGMRTLIPPTRGRPTDKLPRGYWRRLMATRFNRRKYGQRWQAETVNSMIKRLLGSALRARNYWSQNREIVLRILTHNIMILKSQVFYRAPPQGFEHLWGTVASRFRAEWAAPLAK